MSQLQRRAFLALALVVIKETFTRSASGATKKPSPKPKSKATKKAKPKPKSKATKKTTPTPVKSAQGSPTPAATPTSSATATAKPTPTAQGYLIAKSTDLQLRETKIFYIKDNLGTNTGYSLTRTSNGVVAFDIRCTHQGCLLDVKSSLLDCPCHGSVFNPETGKVINGPAINPLKMYSVIESNDEIRIITS